ncbi:hypothetical protein C1Y35_12985 [Pseudomonas sp. GW456-L14]|uniref:hypothetical protein n=1 Tax=unclassified Pseudomonas TaxID=196821 RepID=UPI000C88E34F|nr:MULTISPECIES: hypothetical protein [unclassified Pseudomonas]PMY39728.1 hypothetical protein C1Y35_12985 [Pseudomonas sp. GW456-L14]PMY49074.1 hypothetical protein C1Y34_28990 [Pseudomonas sp. GW456-L12]
MTNTASKSTFKKSPTLWKDLGVLILWLIVLTAIVILGATKLFDSTFDYRFFTARMAPVYSLFGTICLAYEFFTCIRNERNKTWLTQELGKNLEHKIAAGAIVIASDRLRRIQQLDQEIASLNADLQHENQFIGRKYVFGVVGICLTLLSTMLQLP